MKKSILILLLLMSFFSVCSAVNTESIIDSVKADCKKQINDLKTSTQIDNLNKQIALQDTLLKKCESSACHGREVTGWLWLFVLTPILLFFLVTWFVTKRLAIGFNVTEALKENIPIMNSEPNPIYNPSNLASLQALTKDATTAAACSPALSPTIQTSTDRSAPSSSRYAALITVFFGLAIIACFISYYIYSYILCPSKPIDLNYLRDIFIALLAGIAPYGFNRLGAGMQGK